MICDKCETVAYCTKYGCIPLQREPVRFWDMAPDGYYELIDAPGNFWDRHGIIGKTIIVILAVLASCFVAGLVVGFAR